MTEKIWYIARQGQQHGPLSEQELMLFVKDGHVQPDDLVWRQGLPDWVTADQLDELLESSSEAVAESPAPVAQVEEPDEPDEGPSEPVETSADDAGVPSEKDAQIEPDDAGDSSEDLAQRRRVRLSPAR